MFIWINANCSASRSNRRSRSPEVSSIATQSVSARTEALRGNRSISAISPKQSPASIVCSTKSRRCQPLITATPPDSSTNIDCAGSFSRKK